MKLSQQKLKDAAIRGNEEEVLIQLLYGTDPNIEDEYNFTPLLHASRECHEVIHTLPYVNIY